MAARNSNRHRKISPRDWTVPDFMASLALADQNASHGAQQLPESAVELRSHLGGNELSFAQGGDLQINRCGIDARMVVRQEIERHRRNFR